MKLRTKTFLLLIVVVGATLSGLGLLQRGFLEDSLRRAIYAGTEGVAVTAESNIHNFLASSLRDAQAVAQGMPREALQRRDSATLERYLGSMMEVFPQFANGMFLLDVHGQLWTDYPPHPEARGQSFAYREYFQHTMASRAGVVGPPYRSRRTGQPVCTFTAPLRDGQERIVGVLGCSVQLLGPNTPEALRNHKIGRGGYIYIYDSTRLLVMHPRGERILRRDVPPGSNRLFDAGINGFQGVGESVNSRGVPMLMAVRQVRGSNWIVVAQQPRDEALAPLGQARWHLISSVVGGTALALLLGFLVLRRLTAPLSRLRQATEELGGPGFGQRVAGIDSQDEIGDLARAFASMSAQLGQSLASHRAISLQWERTFNSVPEAIFLLDTQGRVRRLNRAAARLLDMDPDQVMGRSCHELLHGTPEPPAHCPHQRVMLTGFPQRVEVLEPHLRGYFEMSATPLAGQEGRLEGTVFIVRDITERRRSETALSESEERYRTLVEQAVDLIVVLQDEHVVFANAASQALLGWPPEEMLGQTARDFFLPEDLPRVMERYHERLAGDSRPEPYLTRVLTRQGQVRWMDLAAQVVQWDGRPALQVIFRDVTDRHQAEMALVQSEHRYRSLVENVPYGLCIVDAQNGAFLYFNKNVSDMFGYGQEEARHLTIWDVTAASEHDIVRQRIARRMSDPEEYAGPYVYTGRRKDGTLFRYEASVSTVHHQGRMALQGIIRDVTAQEILERQVQHSQKMEAVGTLAGGVAHEFNNILMAIRGYSQLMAQTPDLPPRAAEFLAKIEDNTRRAAQLTNTMLSFSRMETGQRRVVQAGQIVEEVGGFLRQTLPPEIDLELELPPGLPPVLANQNQLEQVIVNLTVNARDAMPQGGRLTIRARQVELDREFCQSQPWARPGPYLRLEVADTGQGMDAAVLEHIFEPFFTTKEPGRGTGLGLALAYNLIKGHGGGMVVRSSPGLGSSFAIHLPVARGQAEEAPPPAPPPPSAPGRGQRLLVVDDEPAVREVVREALEAHGYQVAEASQGQEALDIYVQALDEARPFELVLLDLAMPVLDGLACLERLLALDPRARVLLATGHIGEKGPEDTTPRGVAGMLRKPFDLQMLLREVARALEGTPPVAA